MGQLYKFTALPTVFVPLRFAANAKVCGRQSNDLCFLAGFPITLKRIEKKKKKKKKKKEKTENGPV